MRILVADDDPVTRLAVSRLVGKWGYEPLTADNGLEAWDLLTREDAPALAIVDWMMPGIDGIELCTRLRSAPRPQYTYVLLLTARTRKEDVLQGLAAGADDYVPKPVDAAELNVRLRVGRRIIDLQDQLMKALESSRFQATHDSLTGIWNRAAILDFLDREWERSRRQRLDLCVLIADVDHFKKINDTHGHLIGDSVLREIASRMKSALRKYDGLGRYGGEEFLVVAPHCSPPEALTIGERLRSAVAGCPFPLDGHALAVSISVGGATAVEGRSGQETLRRSADDALYEAKNHGRNQVRMRVHSEQEVACPASAG